MPNQQVLEAKKTTVANFVELLNSSTVGVFVNSRGMTVEEDTELRKKLRTMNVQYSVVKNTLMQRAVETSNIEGIDDQTFFGPSALATGEDVLTVCKALFDFSKGNEYFEIKSGFYENKKITSEDIEQYASIPSKEILLSRVLGSLQAPVSKLARTLVALAEKMDSSEEA